MNLTLMAMKALIFKARAFEKSTIDPVRAQQRVLFEYLERNKDTEYGRKYRFSEVKSIKDYQTLVPMSDCESLRPYISRMAKGEESVLTSDKPVYFGLTSGTTNHPKFIPVTKFSRDRKSEVSSLWAYYISRDHPDILKGKILAIVNSEMEGFTESGVMYGTETGHGYKNLPEVVRDLYAIPYPIYQIKDYASRYYVIMRLALEQNITTLATLNPTTILLVCRMAEESAQDMIKDIERGTLRAALNLSAEERKIVDQYLKPNPARAAELRAIISSGRRFIPKYYWPGMQLIECWKGGTVKLYLKELPQYFGGVPVRDFGCLSTEARSSIPMSDEGAGGVLAVNTNFYEFVPVEEMGSPKMRFLLCDQLEPGRQYFLIVTTPGGLYRYNIDDIIKVDGFFNKTPVIEFVQKGLNVVSVMGEKVYESHVSETIDKAAGKLSLAIKFFAATVQYDRPPRYVFLTEFADETSPEKKRQLLATLEEYLGKEDAEYKFARDSLVLGEPILKVMAPGAFERYRAKRIAGGVHDSQFKAPKLSGDPEFQKNFEIAEEICLNDLR